MSEIEYEKPRDERLREWVDETARTNAVLVAHGIYPLYTCYFENGVFKEERRPN